MTDSSPKQEPPYGLRMPPDLKARVKAAAEANNRSMNAEIIHRLQTTFEMDDYQPVENAHPDDAAPQFGPLFGLGALEGPSKPISPDLMKIIHLLVEEMAKEEKK